LARGTEIPVRQGVQDQQMLVDRDGVSLHLVVFAPLEMVVEDQRDEIEELVGEPIVQP